MRMTGGNIRAYLGTMPDFTYDGEGVKISAVREGSPASKAGLQEGDIIIEFGGKKIYNLNDYSYALSNYSPGEKVKIIYLREGNKYETEAILGKR